MQQDPAEVGRGMLPWVNILDVAYATGVRKSSSSRSHPSSAIRSSPLRSALVIFRPSPEGAPCIRPPGCGFR